MARPMSRRRRRSKSMFDRTHMLPSSERAAPLMSEAETTRRAKRKSAGWLLALGASALVHLGILVAFVAYGRSTEPVERAATPLDAPWIGAGAGARRDAGRGHRHRGDGAARQRTCRRRSRAPGMPRAGERDNPIARTRAPADGDGRDRQAPAPDSGLAGGAPLDRAFRLDRSTLRSRLTDGAAEAQPARLRISRRRASPQAIRREPTVGIGDSARTVVPSRAPISLANAAADPALGGEPAGAARAAAPATLSEAPPLVARVGSGPAAPLTRSALWTPRRGGAPSTPSSRGGRPTIAPNGRPRTSFTPGSPIFRARRRRSRSRSPRGRGRPRAPAPSRARRPAPPPRSSAPEIRGSSVARSTSGRSIDATIGTSRRSGSGSAGSGSFRDRSPFASSRGRPSWRSWST